VGTPPRLPTLRATAIIGRQEAADFTGGCTARDVAVTVTVLGAGWVVGAGWVATGVVVRTVTVVAAGSGMVAGTTGGYAVPVGAEITGTAVVGAAAVSAPSSGWTDAEAPTAGWDRGEVSRVASACWARALAVVADPGWTAPPAEATCGAAGTAPNAALPTPGAETGPSPPTGGRPAAAVADAGSVAERLVVSPTVCRRLDSVSYLVTATSAPVSASELAATADVTADTRRTTRSRSAGVSCTGSGWEPIPLRVAAARVPTRTPR